MTKDGLNPIHMLQGLLKDRPGMRGEGGCGRARRNAHAGNNQPRPHPPNPNPKTLPPQSHIATRPPTHRQSLADIGYDNSNLVALAYDWRLVGGLMRHGARLGSGRSAGPAICGDRGEDDPDSAALLFLLTPHQPIKDLSPTHTTPTQPNPPPTQPIPVLEERDAFFTRAKYEIELQHKLAGGCGRGTHMVY